MAEDGLMPSKKTSSEWVPAATALKLLDKHHLGHRGVKLLIAELLRDGELDARADAVWQGKFLSLDESWRRRIQLDHDPILELDQSTWGSSAFWNDDLSNWRWNDSRFVLTHSKRPSKRTFLTGVSFRASQIVNLLPSNRKGIGGRKIDAAAWAKIGVALIELGKEGYFDSKETSRFDRPPRFENATEFIAEVLRKSDEAYDASHAATLLTPVYRAFFPTTQKASYPNSDPQAY
jgi:hypothetical protein